MEVGACGDGRGRGKLLPLAGIDNELARLARQCKTKMRKKSTQRTVGSPLASGCGGGRKSLYIIALGIKNYPIRT
ncbi:hypothetical protein CGRA01v4_05447 [Colletotrichum graminicola]|nr:hypothetical protein CGRA01v4_05447 [Colletotrichum graminicola]